MTYMGDIKLFRVFGESATELEESSVAVEKSLQNLTEKHLETLLGIRFLASEYSTGKTHGGRLDTLGIDENYCPVVIEYKRSINENVITQGLFYYIGSAEGHEYPDLQVGDEVNPRRFYIN